MVLGRCTQGVQCGIALVRHDAQVRHVAAQALQQRTQEEPVGVVDGTRLHVLWRHRAGHHQFVAGRKKRHAGPGCHQKLVEANTGRQPQ